jgi:uridine kinase
VKSFAIGIAGLSGSGKTELARQLAPHLPAPCALISLDSYYHPQAHLTLEQRARLNFDHPDALDWELLAAHLSRLESGEAIEEPRYLFDQHTRSRESTRVNPQPFLIVEGILALHSAEIRELLDIKVFVHTEERECLRRRLERDMAERGRTRDSVLRQYDETVWPMAQQFVIPSRNCADLVVSGEEPLDQSVAAVLAAVSRASRSANSSCVVANQT